MSIIPRELQDKLWESGAAQEDVTYREVKENLIGISNAKAEQVKPAPMEVGLVEGGAEDDGSGQFEPHVFSASYGTLDVGIDR